MARCGVDTWVGWHWVRYLKALIDQSCARIYPVRNIINAILVVCHDTARMVVKKGGTCDPIVLRIKTEVGWGVSNRFRIRLQQDVALNLRNHELIVYLQKPNFPSNTSVYPVISLIFLRRV